MAEQRISQIPGRKDRHIILVENGTEPNNKPMRFDGGRMIDATVKDDMSPAGQARERAAALARVSHTPSQIVTNPVIDHSLEVCLGEHLVLRPSPIHNTPEGWRTKGGVASHEVYQDGELLSSSEAVKAIYDYLVALNAEAEEPVAKPGKGKKA